MSIMYFSQVSLDLVKSLYAKFIDWDEEMYDHDTSTPSHAAKYESNPLAFCV